MTCCGCRPAMTFKAAVAGVGLGGGKGVIAIEPGTELTHELRDAMLLDFADSVELLGGRYITAEDVGTAPTDMRLIASRTEHVVGLPESLGGFGDPSPYTALGVHAAIRASAAHRFGSGDLRAARRRSSARATSESTSCGCSSPTARR